MNINNSKFVTLKNEFGKIAEVKMGYSFTTVFFHFIPDILRGNFKMAGILFLVQCFLSAFTGDPDVGLVLFTILYAVYGTLRNRLLVESYLKKGYKIVESSVDKEELSKFMTYTLDKEVYRV